jgi:hypothetical protein
MKQTTLALRYSGFDVIVTGQNNPDFVRNWIPDKGEYEKNLFCTYLYNGRLEEYKTETKDLDHIFEGELFYNSSVVLPYPTYEILPVDTTWLCFSSYKPYTAEFLRLKNETILPAGVGAFCVLGTFSGDNVEAKALHYLKPREHDIQLTGNAKIVLIKYGQFVNSPAT